MHSYQKWSSFSESKFDNFNIGTTIPAIENYTLVLFYILDVIDRPEDRIFEILIESVIGSRQNGHLDLKNSNL